MRREWLRVHLYGVKRQTFLATVCFGALIILAIGIVTCLQLDAIVREEQRDGFRQQLRQIVNQFSMELQILERDVSALATNSTIRNYVNSVDDLYYKTVLNWDSYLTLKHAKGGDAMRDYFLYFAADRLVMSSDAAENREDLDMATLDWYRALCEKPYARLWVGRFPSRGAAGNACALVQSVDVDSRTNEPRAVIVARMDLGMLDNMLSGTSFTDTHCVVVRDAAGEAVYSSWPDGAQAAGDAYLAYDIPLYYGGWRLWGYQNRGDEAARVRAVQTPIVLALCGCLAIFAVCVYFYAVYLSRPICALNQIMLRAEATDYREKSVEGRNDEIGTMSRSYNKMVDAIRTNLVLRQQAEMKALQSQINPHFLYNALEAIKGVAATHGDRELREMVQRLGEMFRYSLSGGKTARASVRQELDYLANYLYFQRMRFGERVRFSIDVDAAVYDFPLPRMTLQPIVENCLSSGLGNRDAAIRIEIEGRKIDGRTRILVRDDGIGLGAQALREVRAYIETGVLGDSIGLYNVHARLRLQFGAPYGLSIDSAGLGKGCVVTVELPGSVDI